MKGTRSRIARLLFRELVRDRIFQTLGGGAVFLVLASLILNEMVVGQAIKATKDLGLSVLNLFTLFIIIFQGVNLVGREIGRRSLYLLFARSVPRLDFLAGSAGAILMAVVTGLLVTAGTVLALSGLQGELWVTGLLTACFFALCEALVLLSFALLFSVLASTQLAMFLTLLVYAIGHTAQKAAVAVRDSGNLALKILLRWLTPALPNLEFFNRQADIVYAQPIAAVDMALALLYAAAYASLVFLLAARAFARKEL